MYGELATRSFTEILEASSEKDLFERTAHHLRRLGFKSFVYRHRLIGSLPNRSMLDGSPAEWMRRYEAAGYLSIDPKIHRCKRRTDPHQRLTSAY